MVLFIGSNAIMKTAGFAPEGIAVEAVETLRTFLVTISTASELGSLMASTSKKPLIRKLVGSS